MFPDKGSKTCPARPVPEPFRSKAQKSVMAGSADRSKASRLELPPEFLNRKASFCRDTSRLSLRPNCSNPVAPGLGKFCSRRWCKQARSICTNIRSRRHYSMPQHAMFPVESALIAMSVAIHNPIAGSKLAVNRGVEIRTRKTIPWGLARLNWALRGLRSFRSHLGPETTPVSAVAAIYTPWRLPAEGTDLGAGSSLAGASAAD